jgi:hypothetical protein
VTWKGTAALVAGSLAVGAFGAWKLSAPEAVAIPLSIPKPPELGRQVDPPEAPKVDANLVARILADQQAAMAQQARDYRAAMVPLLNAVLAAQGKPQLPPDATPGQVASAAADVGAVKLAEEKAGPGPKGDSVTASAILPCPGCDVHLVFKWDEPEPYRRPWTEPLHRRAWFLELGAGAAANFAPSYGPATTDLVAGWRVAGGHEWEWRRTGDVVHGARIWASYEPFQRAGLFGSYVAKWERGSG